MVTPSASSYGDGCGMLYVKRKFCCVAFILVVSLESVSKDDNSGNNTAGTRL